MEAMTMLQLALAAVASYFSAPSIGKTEEWLLSRWHQQHGRWKLQRPPAATEEATALEQADGSGIGVRQDVNGPSMSAGERERERDETR